MIGWQIRNSVGADIKEIVLLPTEISDVPSAAATGMLKYFGNGGWHHLSELNEEDSPRNDSSLLTPRSGFWRYSLHGVTAQYSGAPVTAGEPVRPVGVEIRERGYVTRCSFRWVKVTLLGKCVCNISSNDPSPVRVSRVSLGVRPARVHI